MCDTQLFLVEFSTSVLLMASARLSGSAGLTCSHWRYQELQCIVRAGRSYVRRKTNKCWVVRNDPNNLKKTMSIHILKAGVELENPDSRIYRKDVA